ncbi:ANTH domain-containing protein [Zychaea mexicana]|uniref:ANTH domain-containing protein n=1 Tax=Zychaea mexicana TaxID=64656 RepID=UPI0022FE3B2B|nr:ANTH domain-containing protein [Zychaea mexicana]KAI9492692.1 ANTH domain-containing protein [Zychaea mexicana]
MSSIMDTAVRKATRLDYQPPKQKHLNTLNALTFQYPASVGDIVDLLERRLRENSWIVTFKVLIILHTLMREGNGDKVIACIDSRPSALDTTRVREKSSGTLQIQNIYLYSHYLQQKVHVFRQLGMDHVKYTMAHKTGKLRHLSVANGLLKETTVVQKLIGALLKCSFQFDDGDNGIGLNAFRLLVEDLFVLFQTVNEAIVNILEHYFAMPKPEARLSLEVYKRFSKQTEHVVAYLNRARILENELGITIPEARHAPLSLATALAEYLNDAESSTSSPKPKQQPKQSPSNTTPLTTNAASQQQQQQQQPKELIDFFASLENEQTAVLATQPTGMAAAYNPFRTTPAPVVAATQPSPSASLSTAAHNPFRSTVTPQQSISTPTFNTTSTTATTITTQPTNNNASFADLSFFTQPITHQSQLQIPQSQQPMMMMMTMPNTLMQQQQQQQQQPTTTSNNKFNPFASPNPSTPAATPTTPFQQPMMTSSLSTTAMGGPVGVAMNSNPFFSHQQRQQQPQPAQQQAMWF